MVTLRLERTDYDRINNLLGVIGNLAVTPLEGAELGAHLAEFVPRFMPPDVARRLCNETDRQAREEV